MMKLLILGIFVDEAQPNLCIIQPLTLGGGYVYKVTYGWVWGIAAGTIISTAGSLLGSCSCFILGRYIMRDRVRKWGRKYPLFDAIDIGKFLFQFLHFNQCHFQICK